MSSQVRIKCGYLDESECSRDERLCVLLGAPGRVFSGEFLPGVGFGA